MTKMQSVLRRADRASAFASLLALAAITATIGGGRNSSYTDHQHAYTTHGSYTYHQYAAEISGDIAVPRIAAPLRGTIADGDAGAGPFRATAFETGALAPAEEAVVVRPSPQEAALAKLAADTRCLAEAMYYEARGEGLAGEEAVAEVVFHRLHRRGYPHSICGVVYQGALDGTSCQFSFVCDGEMNRPKNLAAWRRASFLAAKIVSGLMPLGDATGGATAFHAVDVEPDWSDLERTVQIGNHVFYRPLDHTRSG